MPLRRRSRVKRQIAVLGAFVALMGLLELNRVLPGGWPGGGGDGGFRPWPSAEDDVSRVRPPEDRPPSWPREGVVLTLLGAGGRPPDEAEVSPDAAGANVAGVDAEGRVRLADARTLDHGFLVRLPRGGQVRHGPADPAEAEGWTVHLPDAAPRTQAVIGTLSLVTVRAEDLAPLAGVVVRPSGPGVADLELRSGADGHVELPELTGRTRLSIEAPGRRTRSLWIHPAQAQRELRVRLARSLPAEIRFVDAEDQTPVAGARVRLLSAAGDLLWEREDGPSGPTQPAGDLDLDGALLEVRSPTHPVVQVAVAELQGEIRLPRGRLLEIDVRDARSQRLPGARVTARYAPLLLGGHALPGAEPVDVDVEGRGTSLVVPKDRPARVLVEADHSAPQAIDFAAAEKTERRVVKLSPGARLEVRVVDVSGSPVEGAYVVALASADGLRVQRQTRTVSDGTTTITRLPLGAIEVYAHAKNTAWAVAVAESAPGAGSVSLQLRPGVALRVVVEDEVGLPLAGVRVHASPEGVDAPPDVVPPGSRPQRTSSAGTHVIPDLPRRPYRLRFSKPGYREVVLRDVTPGAGVHFVTLLERDG